MVTGEMFFLNAQLTALLARWGTSFHSIFPPVRSMTLARRTVWAEMKRARRVKSLSDKDKTCNLSPVAFLGCSVGSFVWRWCCRCWVGWDLLFHLNGSRSSSVRRQVVPCAVGTVAGSSCTLNSAVDPSALSTSHISCSAGVLCVPESLAPVALNYLLFLLVLFCFAGPSSDEESIPLTGAESSLRQSGLTINSSPHIANHYMFGFNFITLLLLLIPYMKSIS